MKVTLCSLHVGDPGNAELIGRWACEGDVVHAAKKGSKGPCSLLARVALKQLLHRVVGFGDWCIAATENGKPYLIDRGGARGPCVSLSHGGEWVAVAVGPPGIMLGVDLEPHKARDVTSMAEAAFGPAERQLVVEGEVAAFYRLWTLREAMSKATGQGLVLAADRLDHVGPGPFEGVWRVPGWLLGHRQLQADFSLSLALENPCEEAIDAVFVGPDGTEI